MRFGVPGDLGPSWTAPPRDDEVVMVPRRQVLRRLSLHRHRGVRRPLVHRRLLLRRPRRRHRGHRCHRSTRARLHLRWPRHRRRRHWAGRRIQAAAGRLGQRLADVFGSLLGSADETLGETTNIDEPELDEGVDDELDDDPDNDDEAMCCAEEPVEAAVA